MSLSNDIIKPPKELTCICGKCDLSYVRTTKLKQALKELNDYIEEMWSCCGCGLCDTKKDAKEKIKEIFGEELLEETK